ncbi:MAG TPA: hypothetical protein VFP92_04165 [Rhodanobacteraceae bacterium]|nr:hypothetical protein [Rhodanobacteraceae bacterium]
MEQALCFQVCAMVGAIAAGEARTRQARPDCEQKWIPGSIADEAGDGPGMTTF